MNYYVIEREYVGPNMTDDRYADSHTYRIQSTVGLTNMKHTPLTEGWLGTTGDWAEYARGEYPTLDAARIKIEQLVGADGLREDESDFLDDDVLTVYRHGRLVPWGPHASADWAYEGLRQDVTATTTEERISELAAEYAAALATDCDAALDREAVERAGQRLRDELIRDTREDT